MTIATIYYPSCAVNIWFYYCFSIKTTTGTADSNDFGGITRRDLTFDPGETTIPVTIQIVHDVNVENNENFIVSLETNHPRVQFSRNTATVRIDDDDREYFILFIVCDKIISENVW